MERKYFGTDGVRGRVGEPPMTPDFVMRLGYAAGEVLLRRAGQNGSRLAPGTRPTILIGKDTRISGYMLEASLEAGFAAAGVDVILTGPLPTPAVAYLTRALRLQAGIVISASHNPYEDNGIKFFTDDGGKLPDDLELEIERGLTQPMRCHESAGLGKARRIEDAAGRYIEFCKSTFPNSLDLRGMKIVVDCAHGATYHVAPHVLHELGADVISIGAEPNGTNINDKVGATHPQALQEAVRKQGADLGIALDGDGDRLMMVDQHGALYDGDHLLYVIAKDRVHSIGLKGVVGTLMTNLALEQAFAKLGLGFVRAKVGDRYVLELMQEKNWMLGGENSGHIICLDKHTTGDGIVSALQVLGSLRTNGVTLAAMCTDLTLFPQILINVRVPRGFEWEEAGDLMQAKELAERHLGDAGRILLRPSGTEPVLRVMVEGRDKMQISSVAQELAAHVEKAAQHAV
ncbi:MAG: phosphoglucosamine mutase [Betaproteobacteria bacterium]|nr:phosphoglucosamine mutase [Betaproteobacteria bacterium]